MGNAFADAQARYAQLVAQVQSGAISPEQFQLSVAQLKAQDANGAWWQIDPNSGSWMFWDGAQWVIGQPVPPQQQSAPPPAQNQVDPFAMAESQYRQLVEQVRAGAIAPEQYAQGVAQLQVQDLQGVAWTMSPENGAWLFWDGGQWQPGQPPRPQAQPTIGQEIVQEVKKSAVNQIRSIPKQILMYLLFRIPVVILTYFSAYFYHIYQLAFKNDGFNPGSGPPILNIGDKSTLSSVLAFAFGSGLFWSIAYTAVFTLIRSGPKGLVKNLVAMPMSFVNTLKTGGKKAWGGMILGAGLALLVGKMFSINSPAGYLTAGFMALLGMSRAGFIISGFVRTIVTSVFGVLQRRVTKKVGNPFTGFQVVIFGMAPALFLIGKMANDPNSKNSLTLLGIICIVAGGALMIDSKRPIASAGSVGGALFTFFITACVWALFEVFRPHQAHADDGGSKECGIQGDSKADFDKYMAGGEKACQGFDKVIDHSKGPATAAGIGGLAPGLDPPKSTYLIVNVDAPAIKADGKEGTSVRATVITDDPDVNPAELAPGINITYGGQTSQWINPSGENTVGATKSLYLSALQPASEANLAGSFPLEISATCPGPAGGIMSARTSLVIIAGAQVQLMVAFWEGQKQAIYADKKDNTTVKAWVVCDPNMDETTKKAWYDSITINGGADQWLYTSGIGDDGTVKYAQVWANPPDGLQSTAENPPPTANLTLTATDGQVTINQTFQVGLVPLPRLDVDLASTDGLSFAVESKDSKEFLAYVLNPGQGRWEICNEPLAPEIVTVALNQEFDDRAKVTVTEAANKGMMPSGPNVTSNRLNGTLKLHAKKDDFDLLRDLSVTVMSEGLFVQSTGADGSASFDITADKKDFAMIGFTVYVKKDEKIEADPDLAQRLIWTDMTEEQEATNAISVGKLMVQPDHKAYDGWVYKLNFGEEVPGDGRVLKLQFDVSVPGQSAPEFTARVVVGLKMIVADPSNPDWQREYAICLVVIKYVPDGHKAKLKEMLDKRAKTLGPEGLNKFRKWLWEQAQNLILAEGEEGYKNENDWLDWTIWILEWAEWAGDLCFQALCGIYAGPIGIVGGPIVKNILVSALADMNQYGADHIEVWFDENVTKMWHYFSGVGIDPTTGLPYDDLQRVGVAGERVAQTMLSMLTDPAILEKALGKSLKAKAAAWTLFVGYQFINNVYNGQTMIEAALNAARAARDRAIVEFLIRKGIAAKMAGASGGIPLDQMPQSVKDLASRIKIGPDGKPYADLADVMRIQQEQGTVRMMNECTDPRVKAAFQNTLRTQAYNPHDQRLVDWAKSDPTLTGPEADAKGLSNQFRVKEIRTPGADPNSLNYDRDYVLEQWNRNTGTWEQVPSHKWKNQSYQIFQETTGADAQKCRQRGTCSGDSEASVDMARQRRNAKGELVDCPDNVTQVKHGKGTLKDPGSLGQTYETKTANAGDDFGDAVKQTQKGIKTLNGVRGGYQQQGYNVGNLPPKFQNAANAINNYPTNGTATPAQTEALNNALKQNGFQSIKHFTSSVSGQMQSLKWARK